MVTSLSHLLYSEFELNKAAGHFQMITKNRTGKAADLVKTALHELRKIVEYAECFGVKVGDFEAHKEVNMYTVVK